MFISQSKYRNLLHLNLRLGLLTNMTTEDQFKASYINYYICRTFYTLSFIL